MIDYVTHDETVCTTFLGKEVTMRITLYEDQCAKCGTGILLPAAPDGAFFCEPCRYQRLLDGIFE